MEKVRKIFAIFHSTKCSRCGCDIWLEGYHRVDGYFISGRQLPGATYCRQCATSPELAIELITEFYQKNGWL